MAADAERAQRLKELKDDRPDLRWRQVAEALDVSERSVLEWAKKGALSYDHAKKLAAFLKVDLDWLWRGPEPTAPDLMDSYRAPAAMTAQLDRMETKLDALVRLLSPDDAADLERDLDAALRRADETSAPTATPMRKPRRQRKAR